jgi:hypothetical protein
MVSFVNQVAGEEAMGEGVELAVRMSENIDIRADGSVSLDGQNGQPLAGNLQNGDILELITPRVSTSAAFSTTW